MNDSLLTRFTRDNPCWTAELLRRVGEDSADLGELLRGGLLSACGDGVFCLTASGRESFTSAAAGMYLDDLPGGEPSDSLRCLSTTELWLELERTNRQCRGIKRYLFRPDLPARPALPRERVWNVTAGKLRWLYLSDPVFKSAFDAHPAVQLVDRRPEILDPVGLAAWRALPADTFVPDLFFICRYDFEYYPVTQPHPADVWKLQNTDRYIFSFAADTASRLDVLGALQRWMWSLRRIEIPGWYDIDTQQQDSLTWLIFVTRTRAEAEACGSELGAFGPELVAPANPLEVWTLALDDLAACPSGRELINDVLPEYGSVVCSTLQEDSPR